jgi:hypothetical protein
MTRNKPDEEKHFRAPTKKGWPEEERFVDVPKSGGGAPIGNESLGNELLDCAYNNELKLAEALIKQHAPIDFVDWQTGLTALHIAVGRDHLQMAKYLVDSGALFLPDKQGRTPSVVAAECEVSDEMCDFIAEAEAKAEGI